MPNRRTRVAPADVATARSLPGCYIPGDTLHRLRRCADMLDLLATATPADFDMGRVQPQSVIALADCLGDELRAVLAGAVPATRPDRAGQQ